MCGEKDDEVLVLILSLDEVLRPPFLVERVADCQIGLRRKLAVRVSIDQSLKRKSRLDELAFFRIFLPGFEQGLVRRDDALLQLSALLAASPDSKDQDQET